MQLPIKIILKHILMDIRECETNELSNVRISRLSKIFVFECPFIRVLSKAIVF